MSDETKQDETAADTGYHEPETTVVPPTETPHASPVAWSDTADDTGIAPYTADDDDDDEWTDEERAYERRTVQIFAGLIGVAVIAAAFMGVMWWTHRSHDTNTASKGVTYTHPPVALSDDDAAFMRSLQASGINNLEADGAIRQAKQICRLIDQGRAKTDITADMHDHNGDVFTTQGMAQDFVNSAEEVYCPNSPTAAPAPAPVTETPAPTAVAEAPPAEVHLSAADSKFLTFLRQNDSGGKYLGVSDATLISNAHLVCTDLANKSGFDDVTRNLDLSNGGAAWFADTASANYCPQYGGDN